MLDPDQIKTENISVLRKWQLPVIKHLPTLDPVSELKPQSAEAVARRCVILIHVIMIGHGESVIKSGTAIAQFGLTKFASSHERQLFQKKKPSKQEKIDATWLTECMQSLAWCLKLADLEHFKHCDDDLADKFPAPYSDPSAFIRSASMRSYEEIYRQADLHYRLHWAARHSMLSNKGFPISESIVRERRRALDWVIGVEADWDEVPSDT